jgi:hypothetical protein
VISFLKSKYGSSEYLKNEWNNKQIRNLTLPKKLLRKHKEKGNSLENSEFVSFQSQFEKCCQFYWQFPSDKPLCWLQMALIHWRLKALVGTFCART